MRTSILSLIKIRNVRFITPLSNQIIQKKIIFPNIFMRGDT